MKELLVNVRNLLSDSRNWTKRQYASGPRSPGQSPYDDSTTAVCVLGAAARLAGDQYLKARELRDYLTEFYPKWTEAYGQQNPQAKNLESLQLAVSVADFQDRCNHAQLMLFLNAALANLP